MCYVHLFLITIICLLTSQKWKRLKTQRALISFQISSVCSPDFRKKLRQIIFPESVYSFLYGTDHIYEVPKHIKPVAQAGKFSQVVNKGTCPGKAGARSRLLFKDFTRRLGACTDTFSASPSQVLNHPVPARKKKISRKAASSRSRPRSTHIWHICLPETAESSLQVARLTKTEGVVYILHKSILLNPLHISVGNGLTPFLMPSVNALAVCWRCARRVLHSCLWPPHSQRCNIHGAREKKRSSGKEPTSGANQMGEKRLCSSSYSQSCSWILFSDDSTNKCLRSPGNGERDQNTGCAKSAFIFPALFFSEGPAVKFAAHPWALTVV